MCYFDKRGWKTILYLNSDLYIAAAAGVFGDDAKKAADEYVEEMSPIYIIIIILMMVGFLVWLVGHVFGIW
jgi:hypothetical protein